MGWTPTSEYGLHYNGEAAVRSASQCTAAWSIPLYRSLSAGPLFTCHRIGKLSRCVGAWATACSP